MMYKTLSVIMPNYNHAQYISEALEAILSQSFRPLEVIVVDDGSTDNSVAVIEQFARRDPIVRLLRNDKNMGVVYSVNRGLSHASGDYVYGAAADDKILPGFFEKSMKLLAQYPQAGLCCSDPAIFDSLSCVVNEDRQFLSIKPSYFSPDDLVKLMRLRQVRVASFTSIIRRSAILEAGGFLPELRWHYDFFVLFIVAFRYGICYVPEPLATFRMLPNSYSASGMKRWPAQRKVLNHMLCLLKSIAYSDVLPMFKKSGVLSKFDSQILCVILKKPEYWEFLNPLLIRRSLWYGVLKMLSPITPYPVKRVYRSIRAKKI